MNEIILLSSNQNITNDPNWYYKLKCAIGGNFSEKTVISRYDEINLMDNYMSVSAAVDAQLVKLLASAEGDEQPTEIKLIRENLYDLKRRVYIYYTDLYTPSLHEFSESDDLCTIQEEIKSSQKVADERGYSAYNAFDELVCAAICFLGDTKVKTDQGNIRFDKLTKTNTIFNKKIKKITKVMNSKKSLILINKYALGNKFPTKDTYISINHGIYLDTSFTKIYNLEEDTSPYNYYIPGKSLVRARNLIKLNNVTEIFRKNDILYNVLLGKHGKMLVNGIICETLHPYNKIVQIYF